MNISCPRYWLLVTGAALLLGATAGKAATGHDTQGDGSQPVLVELFTSEGCSSCPPADRLLADLDRRQDVRGASVVVLSEHVDYWNHLGWRDPYSSPEWTARQSAYAERFHLDSVYTPQVVVDGFRQVTGSDADNIRRAITESAGRKKIDLRIAGASWNGSTLETRIAFSDAPNAVLYAAIADDADKSSVARGENAGRQLEHVAVVRTLTQLAQVHGSSADQNSGQEFGVAFPKGLPKQHLRLVVFIQEANTGRVLGIASREL